MKDTLAVLGSSLVVAIFAHVSNAAHLHPRETPPPSRLDACDLAAGAAGVLVGATAGALTGAATRTGLAITFRAICDSSGARVGVSVPF